MSRRQDQHGTPAGGGRRGRTSARPGGPRGSGSAAGRSGAGGGTGRRGAAPGADERRGTARAAGAPARDAKRRAGAGGSPWAQPRAAGARAGAARRPQTHSAGGLAGRRKGEWYEVALPDHLAGAGLGLVAPHIPVPPKLLRELSAHNGVTVHGRQLRLRLFPREPVGIPADWMNINVLYEDDFVLVVNKPAGVEIHPSVKGQRGTLANGVAAYFEATSQPVRVRPLHRLDKETTGPVLFAKNEFAQAVLEKSLREKEIDREYVAISEGVISGKSGKIDLPIGQDRHHSTRRRVSETGETALTFYEVAERFAEHTLVRLKLETGRTHQIRVHLSAIGHPIAGDGMYGGHRTYIDRQALHGEKLSWAHPWTGDRQSVRAPLPDDMAKALTELRKSRK